MSEAADRILSEATRLFAQLGYAGTSVRAITEAAGTNVNGVSYHFQGKQGLYQAILNRFGREQLTSAKRILDSTASDAADLETRLLIFTGEVLGTYRAQPELLAILLTEFQQGFRNCEGAETREVLSEPSDVLIKFLERAKRKGLLRRGADPAFITGTLMERIGNQVLYADSLEESFGSSIRSEKYTQRWIRQLVELILHGALEDSTK